MNRTTIIIGASPREDRYSNMAQKALTAAGHTVLPYHPSGGEIDGVAVITDLNDELPPIDTVTIYVRPEILSTMIEKLIALKPGRVIFNPGTEDAVLEKGLRAEGIEVVEACTLVMLKTAQY
ncbi:MAG: CoA-binding protein [Akkermansiaceae bacterium]|nr:CoA-binding protein [Akkermansiaceae bacterium]